jgi:pimeloyl-ACP methyl ester carboxylesterase
MGKMEKVLSQDGTPVAFERSGVGSPLVLVHGTSADRSRWAYVLPFLEEHFTVIRVDRRGRGDSGDAPDYSIGREFEDIAAVVDSLTGPVDLLGHSYGGPCVLGAALLTNNVRRLILYEPDALQPGDYPDSTEMIRKMEAMLASGDRDGVVAAMFRDIVGVEPHELEHMRSDPVWTRRMAAAHTIPRELYEVDTYRLDLRQLARITVPVLFLVGGDSSTLITAGTKTLSTALPDSRVRVMPGQKHIAMTTAPELFAKEVIAFLQEPRYYQLID